ncbi:hypothetical protein [Streptomyces sp. NPDC006285]|uniref:hypothetical protein n=1 Tax=Streptomyces sp. NPDC006285 TaxID=3364742 RepID=UPI0036B2F0D7
MVSVSSPTDLYRQGMTHAYFQLRPDENALSTPVIHDLSHVDIEKSRRTALVDDRAASRTSLQTVRTSTTYPPSAGTTTTLTVPADGEDCDTVAAAVVASDAQAVVHAGSPPHRAARCARALRRAGSRGTRIASAAGPAVRVPRRSGPGGGGLGAGCW